MSKSTRIVKNQNPQKGFSLIELMISMTISMIVLAGVIALFANTVRSNAEGLQYTRLNQELRAIMDVMVRDIRRAGYYSAADGTSPNPFQPGNKAVVIGDSGKCITYLYQKDTSKTAADPKNQFGFRVLNNTIKMRRNGSDCTSTTNWEAISDANVVAIDTLTFELAGDQAKTYCTNLTTDITNEGENCTGANVGDVVATVYVVTVTLSGHLIDDASVNLTLTEKVVVRNPVIRVQA